MMPFPVVRDYNKHLVVFGLYQASDYKNMPLLINGNVLYGPFDGSQGMVPYQVVIDYVTRLGGLVFWAHPESKADIQYLTARMYNPPYPYVLKETERYTGFSAFPSGQQSCVPGGRWDKLLKAYCAGKRKNPVWIMGESDFHGNDGAIDNPASSIDDIATVLFTREKSQSAILESFREGRMYATIQISPLEFKLKIFTIEDSINHIPVNMGDTLLCTGKLIIRIEVEDNNQLDSILLIRSGDVIRDSHKPVVRYVETGDRVARYYRLDIRTKSGGRILSNPIFVKPLLRENPFSGEKDGIR